MPRPWKFGDVVLLPAETSLPGSYLSNYDHVDSPALQASYVRRWLASPHFRTALMNLCRELNLIPSGTLSPSDPRQAETRLIQGLAKAFDRGDLYMFRARYVAPATTEEAIEGEEAAGAQSKASADTVVKTWVEFQLFDEDGDPRKQEDYVAVLPIGTKRGKLDNDGFVRFSNLPPGTTCSISFPKIDYNRWLGRGEPSEPDPGTAAAAPEQPTFPPGVDNAAQGSAMLEASDSGAPFCPT